MPKIKVENVEISVIKVGGEDYISLTDMVREVENGSALIEKWLRNKNTIKFLGIWEEMCNPDFNSPEFGGIMAEAGTNRFLLSVKQWIERQPARLCDNKSAHLHLQHGEQQCGDDRRRNPAAATP